MKHAKPIVVAVLLAVGVFALFRCGDDKPRAQYTPLPPLPISPPGGTEPEIPLPPGSPSAVTFSQILLLYKPVQEVPHPRTKDEAYTLAKSLIAQLKSGTRIEMLLKYSDDKGPDGKPFNDGSVSLASDSKRVIPLVKRVAFSLSIGQVAPDPVDVGFAFLVIRRDA